MALQLIEIADITVASPVTSVDFTSIPSGYTDLLIKVSLRSSDGNVDDGANIYFNSDTTVGNYSFRRLRGSGSAASSDNSTASYRWSIVPGNTATSNTFGNLEFYIPNYTSSNYKSASVDLVTENNATAAVTALVAGLWNQTAAITSISIASGGNYFLTNTTATLYGVL
jgi:hypothetical protein